MENMKEKNNTWLIVLLVLIILGLAGYICYDKLMVKKPIPEKTSESTISIEEAKKMLDNIQDVDGRALYSYYKSGKKDLVNYLTSLDNSRKLELGIDETRSFSKIKSNLLKKYNSDLGVEAKDYYWISTDQTPTFIYNKENDTYEWNPEIGGSDAISDLGGYTYYLYKLKDSSSEGNTLVVEYYGLWKEISEVGPFAYFNNQFEYHLDLYDGEEELDGGLDASKLEKYFKESKDSFVQFKFTFSKINNNIVLKDFKVL